MSQQKPESLSPEHTYTPEDPAKRLKGNLMRVLASGAAVLALATTAEQIGAESETFCAPVHEESFAYYAAQDAIVALHDEGASVRIEAAELSKSIRAHKATNPDALASGITCITERNGPIGDIADIYIPQNPVFIASE